MGLIKELTTDNYAFEVESECGIAVVDFYGDRCIPCKELLPILEKLSEEYTDKVKFFKINTNQNMGLAKEFKIMGLPTLMIYSCGEVAMRQTGELTEALIKSEIEKLL